MQLPVMCRVPPSGHTQQGSGWRNIMVPTKIRHFRDGQAKLYLAASAKVRQARVQGRVNDPKQTNESYTWSRRRWFLTACALRPHLAREPTRSISLSLSLSLFTRRCGGGWPAAPPVQPKVKQARVQGRVNDPKQNNESYTWSRRRWFLTACAFPPRA
jgi:hypothetical protein